MLIQQKESCLLLVDVQEKLTPLVHDSQTLIDNCQWLLRVADKMQVPVIVSEQYPSGLGATIPELLSVLQDYHQTEKIHFSYAADENCLWKIMGLAKEQIIICGIEAHVCVLQTALDLLLHDKQVFVVADAISAVDQYNKEVALMRMRDAGIQIVTKQMVLFEWLHQAGTEQFRAMSREFLR